MFYDIHYNCPECAQSHLATNMVQFEERDLAGLPLTEVYYQDQINKLLSKIVECPSSNKPINPELSRFFLAITPSFKDYDEIWRPEGRTPLDVEVMNPPRSRMFIRSRGYWCRLTYFRNFSKTLTTISNEAFSAIAIDVVPARESMSDWSLTFLSRKVRHRKIAGNDGDCLFTHLGTLSRLGSNVHFRAVWSDILQPTTSVVGCIQLLASQPKV